MQLLPRDAPAEIRRRGGLDAQDEVVASGPLILMVQGLMALDAAERGTCRIITSSGEMTARQAASALRRWSLAPGAGQ